MSPGWGLGFRLDRVNGCLIAEHGGDIGGFSSLFALLPEEHAGFFIVTHGEGGDRASRSRMRCSMQCIRIRIHAL